MGVFTNVWILAMFSQSSVCLGREPLCSRYHYEEQILSKVLRLEQRLDLLDDAKVAVTMYTRCPDTWVQFQGSCYIFVDEKVTYDHAWLHCASLGAHLVKVSNDKESIFITKYLRRFKDNHYWIGLTDTKTEGQFDWDGENIASSFTNWISGQPDNSGGVEHCVHMHYSYDYKWNDSRCSASFMFICEKDSSDSNDLSINAAVGISNSNQHHLCNGYQLAIKVTKLASPRLVIQLRFPPEFIHTDVLLRIPPLKML